MPAIMKNKITGCKWQLQMCDFYLFDSFGCKIGSADPRYKNSRSWGESYNFII